MKFIQVFNRYLKPGGEENSAKRIAGHLELGGHCVVRFWRSSGEWVGPHAPAKFRQPFLMWRNATVLDELQAFHEKEKPDAWILHNILPVISLGVYGLARNLNVPVIQWLHNYRPLSPGGALQAGNKLLRPNDPWIAWKEIWGGTWHGPFLTAMVSLGYARATRRGDFSSVRAWIAVSDEMRNIFVRAGWPEDRLFTLRHSWDARDTPVVGPDEGYFLYLGRMVEAKGVRFLVELWKDAALSRIQLVMAGEGPLLDELRTKAPENVRWVRYVEGETKRRFIIGARAIVLPSLWPEPLSTVAYEAYESGKPVITSNVGGMKEIVAERETGRVLATSDARAWREAIVELVHNPDLARQWGTHGKRWLQKNLSPAAWNVQFGKILEQVVPC